MAIAGFENFLWKVCVFDLNGCVVDPEHFACNPIYSGEKLRPVGTAPLSHNVTAHGEHARCKRPDVQIMN